MSMLSFEKKYRVRGGTLVGGDLFDFWNQFEFQNLPGVPTFTIQAWKSPRDQRLQMFKNPTAINCKHFRNQAPLPVDKTLQ